ncbi:MAG: outer membrane beta-barrel protein [Candidatus Azobacteroides sp.]|nr:outer membrane beta-barrel protein [Candidatus Azobacteroides sp.]
MKRIFLFIFSLMTSMSIIHAQDFQLHVGAVFPTGDFGDESKNRDIGEGLGFASTGFNIGAKLYTPVSVENLSLVFTLDFFYNGLKSDYKDEVEKYYDDVSFPSYLNIPVTAGVNYTYPVNENIGVFGEVGLGLNFSKMTAFKYEDAYDEEKYTFDLSSAFCYALEAGVLFNNKYTVGLRYNGLGSHKYKVKDLDGDKWKTDKSLSITNLTLAVGIKF